MTIPIDKLVRTRRKTVALIVERDGSLTVRASLRFSETHIRQFVESHAAWIARSRSRLLASPAPASKQYAEGETFLYLGKPHPLKIVPHQRQALSFDGSSFRLAKAALPKAPQAFIRWYKEEAARLCLDRVDYLSKKHAFRYQKIRISSARTRWGSCSSRGTLSFTYRLVMAPSEALEYVVLHELVHTQIHNHSATFWKKVAELMPDYKKRQAWLKKNGKYLL